MMEIVVVLGLLLAVLLVARAHGALKNKHMPAVESLHEANLAAALMDSIPAWLLTLDTNLIVTGANKGLRQSGLVRCPIVGKPIGETGLLRLIDPAHLEKALVTRDSMPGEEVQLGEGGDVRYFRYSAAAISSSTVVVGLTVSFVDITEIRVLQGKVARGDRMEGVGRVAAGIVHEIRNPLASIDMYVRLVPERFHDRQFRRHMSEDLTNEIQRIDQLTRGLLDYAKPSAPQRVSFSAADEVCFVLRLLQASFAKNNVRIANTISDDVVICFDRQQFRQILLNLLLNGVQAVEEVEYPVIALDCTVTRRSVTLHISNNGRPIAKADQANIFEPFFSTKADGTGLGLSVVSQLCKENHSEISLRENSARRVQFALRIPRESALSQPHGVEVVK